MLSIASAVSPFAPVVPRPRCSPTPLALALALAFAAMPPASRAQALPTGGVAIHGQSQITQPAANQLRVTTQNGAGTNHSAIDWQGFSIGAGAGVYFQQPGATSTSINRVVTNTPSQLFGNLGSNGHLVLVNQAGIAVGAGAVIDTAGFTASTLGMSQADAIAGRMRFGDAGVLGTATLTVDGQILARHGDVVLIAPQLDTGASALVQAPNGATVLAAGQQVEITGRGLEGIRLVVQAPENAVRNLGMLTGDAVGIFAGTLHHSGQISATTAALEGGRVVLKAAGDVYVEGQGTVTATGTGVQAHGGSVDVLGHRVVLTDQAQVDVSGTQGGGRIRIGGDFQGRNAEVPNAERTYVGPDTTVRADAMQRGEGGRIIVWADQQTLAAGQISARGGALGGDGGFAEVSGKQALAFDAAVNLGAPQGHQGTLLLDPQNITLTNSGATLTQALLDFLNNTLGLNTTINVASLSGLAGDVVLQATQNIDVNAAINLANKALTLQAQDDINVSAGITLTTAGKALTLEAGGIITVNAALATNNGAIVLQANAPGLNGPGPSGSAVYVGAGGSLASTNGAITLWSEGSDVGGNSIYLSGTVNAGTGTLTLQGQRIDQVLGSALFGGSVSMLSDAAITLAGTTLASAGLDAQTSSSVNGDMVVTNLVESAGAMSLDIARTLRVASTAGSAAALRASGGQTIDAQTVQVQGGTGGAASIENNGTGPQTITANTVTLTGGATGSNNYALIRSNGDQSLSSINYALTGGAGTIGNFAAIRQVNAGAFSQTVTVRSGGSVVLQGGSSTASGLGAGVDNSHAAIDAEGTGGQTVQFLSGGNLTLTGGSVGSGNYAEVWSRNNQVMSGNAVIQLTGGTSGGSDLNDNNNGASLVADLGNQSITAQGITLQGGSGGTANAALIVGQMLQTLTVGAGGISMTGGGGTGADKTNLAGILQFGTGAGAGQQISLQGNLTLQGGSSAATNVGLYLGTDPPPNFGAGSSALIRSDGLAQTITFTTAGRTLGMTGGSNGSRNEASIEAYGGTQTIQGSTTANAPTLQITAGSGGVTGEGNYARITNYTAALQTLDVGTTTLNGGNGTGVDGAALVTAALQDITVRGSLALQGGSGTTTNGGARIGGRVTGNTNLTLHATGNIDVTGQANGAALGSSPTGVAQTNTIDATADGNITLTPGGVSGGVRVGSRAGDVQAGDIRLVAGNSITLAAGGGGTAAIRTLGDVALSATSGSITQDTTALIMAGFLSANAHSGIGFGGSGNAATLVYLNNASSGAINFTGAAGATTTFTGIDQFAGGNVGLYVDGFAATGPINALGGTVTIAPATAARDVRIETAATPGVLSLSPAALQSFHTGDLRIGRFDGSGTLTLDAVVSGLDVAGLALWNGGNIVGTAGSNLSLASDVELRASGDITLTGVGIFLADNRSLSIQADQDLNGTGSVSIDRSTLQVGSSAANTLGNMGVSGATVQVSATTGSTSLTVQGAGNQAFQAQQEIRFLNGSSGTDDVLVTTGTGTQSFSAGTMLRLQGGAGDATTTYVSAGGAQTVSALGLEILGGASGTANGNYAWLQAAGNQTLAVGAAGITLTGGGGSFTANNALLTQSGSGNTQTISLTGGGGITLQGGSSSGGGWVSTPGGATQGSGASLGTAGTQAITLDGGAITLQGGTVGRVNIASLYATGASQSISGASSLTITGGANGGADDLGNFATINASGTQTISASSITLTGGANGAENFARILSQGNQGITASGMSLTGGADGGGVDMGNRAVVQSNASQTLTLGAGGLTLTGGGGSLTDNAAMVLQEGTGSATQTITIGTGGNLAMTGGSSAMVGVGGATHGSRALIESLGAAQTISLATGGITLTGGSAGSRAYAQIYAENGSQTVNAAGALVLTGGSGGGAADEGNLARILASAGLQTINAGATTLLGGAAGTENTATIQAPAQQVTIGGNLALTGGGSTTGGARIGGTTGNTQLALDVAGNVTLSGGSGSGAAIGSSSTGSGLANTITLHATGALNFNPSGTRGVRIGSTAADVAGGNISVSADGGIVFNASGTVGTAAIRTLGNVTLQSSAGSINQSSEAVVLAGQLSASAQGFIGMLGTNSVGRFAANTDTGDIAFSNTQAFALGNIDSANGLLLSTGGNGAITQAAGSTVLVEGDTSINTGSGNIALTEATNNFQGAVGATGGIVRIRDATGLLLDDFHVAGLVVQAGGAITVGGSIQASLAGDAVALASLGGALDATDGSILTPNGRWLLYLAAPGAHAFGSLAPDFKQYGATLATPVLGAGNGLLYGITPTVGASLGGAPLGKTYDGLASIATAGAVATATGALSGDAVVLGLAATGTLDSKNVGTGKTMTAGVQIASASAGGIPVYGYVFTDSGTGSSSVSGAVATVTPATITGIGGVAATKTYDGSTALTPGTTLQTTGAVIAGAVAGDQLGIAYTGGGFGSANAGTQALLLTGVSLTGADAGNYVFAGSTASGTGTILALPTSTWTGSGGDSLWSNPLNWALGAVPAGQNVLAVVVPVGSGSIVFDAAAGSTSLQSLTSARPVVLSGGSLDIGSLLQTSQYSQSGGALVGAGQLQVSGSFSQSGGSISVGSVDIAQASGNLQLGQITAGSMQLAAATGAIVQRSGTRITTGALLATANQGIVLGNSGNQIGSLSARNTGSGNIMVRNAGVLTLQSLANAGGDISVDNVGEVVSLGAIEASNDVVVGAHSPLTIGNGGVTAGHDIVLSAGDAPGTPDDILTLNGALRAGNSVTLFAGSLLQQNNAVFGANGITAFATDTIRYGLLASANNPPISYRTAAGVMAPPPRVAGQSAQEGPSNPATFTDSFRQQVDGAPPQTLDERRKDEDAIVAEGEICK